MQCESHQARPLHPRKRSSINTLVAAQMTMNLNGLGESWNVSVFFPEEPMCLPFAFCSLTHNCANCPNNGQVFGSSSSVGSKPKYLRCAVVVRCGAAAIDPSLTPCGPGLFRPTVTTSDQNNHSRSLLQDRPGQEAWRSEPAWERFATDQGLANVGRGSLHPLFCDG